MKKIILYTIIILGLVYLQLETKLYEQTTATEIKRLTNETITYDGKNVKVVGYAKYQLNFGESMFLLTDEEGHSILIKHNGASPPTNKEVLVEGQFFEAINVFGLKACCINADKITILKF